MQSSIARPRLERRSFAVHIHESQIFNPGIKRLVSHITQSLSDHDLLFIDHDPEKYQALYSLLNHDVRVGDVAYQVAIALGWSQTQAELARLEGLCHDLGKLDRTCWKYRSVDLFSDEERRDLTVRHQRLSRRFVMNLKPFVREEDRYILSEAAMVVGYHHNDPHEIPLPSLRIKCLLIRMVDIFITVQEDRKYQLGKSEWQALNIVGDVVSDWRADPRFDPFIKEAQAIHKALSELFGPENLKSTYPLG